MNGWLKRPAFWLIIQPALVLMWLGWRGALAPQIVPDTASYETGAGTSMIAWLSAIRPFGYPLFLKVAAVFGDGYVAVPWLHFVLHVVAVWIFYWGLRRAGMRSWISFWAASSLFYGHTFLSLTSIVFSDPLAIACAIASSGCMIAVAAQPRSTTAWVGAIVSTFLIYQVQPAYLFVIALWPILGFLLAYVFHHRLRAAFAITSCLIAAIAVPFLLFCGIRWMIVGHFGLVSFGGYNIVGIAGQLLTEDDIRALDQDLQPLARAIVERRKQLLRWQGTPSFHSMEQMFNPIVWDISVPIARQKYAGDPVKVNRQLSRLSRSTIAAHPWGYARWLVWNIKHGFVQMVVLTAKDNAVLFTLVALLGAHFVRAWRGPVMCLQNGLKGDDAVEVRFRESQVLVWLAVGFALGKLLLVVLVEPANDRYMTGAMVFVPPAIASLALPYLLGTWQNSRNA